MDVSLLFPSKYLKAADLRGKDVTLKIEKLQVDALQMTNGKKEKKPVVYFEYPDNMPEERRKSWVINKTNAMAIAAAYGNETDDWKGKRVTLFPTKDRFQGKMVDCIRVRSCPDAREPGDD